MIPLSIADIAEITGGSLDCVSDPDQRVTGFIEFDSRKVTKGGLFLALPGARVDGHDYAEKAIEQGAVAVLASRPAALCFVGSGVAMALAITSIGQVAGIVTQVRQAQRSRGVRLAPWAWVMPVLVLTLRHADDVGDALQARGAAD